MTNPHDIPFEEAPDGPVPTDIEALMAHAVVVRACTVGTPPGALPALAFDFLLPGDKALATVLLVQGPGDHIKFAELIKRAVLSANGGAIRVNSQKKG